MIWDAMSLTYHHCNNVIVNIITVAPGEHHAVLNQRHFDCLFNGLFRLATEKCLRYVLLAMCRAPNNTRLYMVVIFDTFLCGANTFATIMTVIGILYAEHGRHINCNGQKTISVAFWWVQWRLKSLASLLIALPFVSAQIKDRVTGFCQGNVPLTKGHWRVNCFRLMTSWWQYQPKGNT